MTGRQSVVVLGGGVTGLSAAWKLARAGCPVTVLECEGRTGGLAATIAAGPYRCDFGPHAYHASEAEILDVFLGLAGSEMERTEKNVVIKFRGKCYSYPLQPLRILAGLNFYTMISCVGDYLSAQMRRTGVDPSLLTAEEYLVGRYGRTIYDIFFGPYSQKVWGVPLGMMSAAFSAQRIPYPSMGSLIRDLVRRNRSRLDRRQGYRDAPLGYAMYYPRRGAGVVPEKIAAEIVRLGGRIELGATARAIAVENGRTTAVEYDQDGRSHTLKADAVVATIPLSDTTTLVESCPQEVRREARLLFHRSLLVVAVGVRRNDCLPAQSVYLTNRLFNRVSDLKRYGATETAPPGGTVLTVELTCDEGDRYWAMDRDLLISLTMRQLEDEGILRRRDVEWCDVLRARHGYPVYLMGYERTLRLTLESLGAIANLFFAGRQGFFKYMDMDLAMKSGFETAAAILTERPRISLDAIAHQDRLSF